MIIEFLIFTRDISNMIGTEIPDPDADRLFSGVTGDHRIILNASQPRNSIQSNV